MALSPRGYHPREDVASRFLIAQDRTDINMPGSLELQKDTRAIYLQLADFINATVMDSREKSLSLTHLEESMMWFGKALFKPVEQTGGIVPPHITDKIVGHEGDQP
jgi:hypothetical protein